MRKIMDIIIGINQDSPNCLTGGIAKGEYIDGDNPIVHMSLNLVMTNKEDIVPIIHVLTLIQLKHPYNDKEEAKMVEIVKEIEKELFHQVYDLYGSIHIYRSLEDHLTFLTKVLNNEPFSGFISFISSRFRS